MKKEPRPRTGQQYAFWATDEFPFVAGGLITAIRQHPRKDGYGYSVEVEGYGHGWPPEVLLPRRLGERVHATLNRLRGQRLGQQQAVNAQFNGELVNYLAHKGKASALIDLLPSTVRRRRPRSRREEVPAE